MLFIGSFDSFELQFIFEKFVNKLNYDAHHNRFQFCFCSAWNPALIFFFFISKVEYPLSSPSVEFVAILQCAVVEVFEND